MKFAHERIVTSSGHEGTSAWTKAKPSWSRWSHRKYQLQGKQMTPVWGGSISHAQPPAKTITRIFAIGGGGDCDTCHKNNVVTWQRRPRLLSIQNFKLLLMSRILLAVEKKRWHHVIIGIKHDCVCIFGVKLPMVLSRRAGRWLGDQAITSVRPSEAWKTLFWPVNGSVGSHDQPLPFYGMSVRQSVSPCVRPSGEFSGHLPENDWREWPEILHADVFWPSKELISSWSRSVDFLKILALFWLSETGQISGFQAFPGERMEGIAWNFAGWCILTTISTG